MQHTQMEALVKGRLSGDHRRHRHHDQEAGAEEAHDQTEDRAAHAVLRFRAALAVLCRVLFESPRVVISRTRRGQ